jgi:hypothetical protein
MYTRTQNDCYDGHEERSRRMDAYRAAVSGDNIQPTVEEYESIHGDLQSHNGNQGWSEMDIQHRPYNHGDVDIYASGDQTSHDDLPYVNDNEPTSDFSLADSFKDCVDVKSRVEPLLRDQRDDWSFDKARHDREQLMRNPEWESELSLQEGTQVDAEILITRAPIPDQMLAPGEDVYAADPHFTSRSESFERMREADERMLRGEKSVLGTRSYGNYGF